MSSDPFQNQNDKSCRDLTRKDLHNMVLCTIWQKQRNSLRQSSERFYLQRLHILGSHKQHVHPKEREHLRDSKMKFGVWI